MPSISLYNNIYKKHQIRNRRINMKGQAAMEYLMTYGWAILIIVVVVAALYLGGVFNVGERFIPPTFSYFAYVDYAGGTLKVRNGPQDVDTISVTSPVGATADIATASPGEDITITGIPTTGDQTITISYVVTTSGLTHTDTATLNQ